MTPRPVTASTHQFSTSVNAAAPSTSSSLLICGPGVLGSYLAKLWLDEYGPGTVTGQTNTTNNHPALSAIGVSCRTKDDAAASTSPPGTTKATFPNVVYSAPPSGSTDYAADVSEALTWWDKTGAFVFTSSAGVYSIEDGSACDESAPVVPLGSNPRTDAILRAEQAVLDAGGCVVRLVGLYHRTRGAHTFFIKQGQVERWGGYTVNLIHYEDAAALVHAVLQASPRSEVFLGCDNAPVTFQDMMDAIQASGELPGVVTFTGKESAAKGKRMNNNKTRERLGWAPKYGDGIQAFFTELGGKDYYYYQQEKVPSGAPHV